VVSVALQPESIVAVEAEAELALVARAVGGDDQAFRSLVERHQGRIVALLHRLCGCPEQALDLAQETFLAAYRHLGSFRQDSRFSTWLHAIAVNQARSAARRRRPTASLDAVASDGRRQIPEPVAHGPAVSAGLEQAELALRIAAVERAVSRSPELARLVAAPSAAVAAGEPQRAARQPLAQPGSEADKLAEPLEVMVRGPVGREKLLAYVASLGLTTMPRGAEVLELVGPEEAVAAFLADPLGAGPSFRAPPSAKGSPVPGEAALLASEAGDGEAKAAWSDRRPGGPAGTSGELARATPAAAAPPRRILVRVIELPAAGGEPSEP
jgi:RNA polymerase sigma factor (sigma-70 family)